MDQIVLTDDDFYKHGSPPKTCVVCGSKELQPFMKIDCKYYWTCVVCKVRILSQQHWLSSDEEFKYYQTHRNISSDPGYQKFVSQLANPILNKLTSNSRGLDFGSGPDPALSVILRQNGHQMTLYDPFFFPCKQSLKQTYDFIVCSEAAEHFHEPAIEFQKFDRLLVDNGWIGIMTNFQTEDTQFKNWHYRRDPTHVIFYRQETFKVIGKRWNWEPYFPSKNVVLFQKNGKAA